MNTSRIRWLVILAVLTVILLAGSLPQSKSAASTTTVQLLVIGPEEFRGALSPLIAHKNRTGISAEFLALETIYVDPDYNGADEPEEIKRAIADYNTNNATQYVMLVGDINKFPVRWIRGQFIDGLLDDADTTNDDIVFHPSDYYFADLYTSGGSFNDWDADNDGYYGELYLNNLNPDAVDFTADVMVGRVPAEDVTQVRTYVAKVIRYEYNYLTTKVALIAQTEWFDRIYYKEAAAEALESAGVTTLRMYDKIYCCDEFPDHDDCYDCGGPIYKLPTAANLIYEINYGADFISQLYHGNYDQWAYSPAFNTTLITSSLTNDFRYPVVYSGACATARFFGWRAVPYRSYTDLDGTYHTGVEYGTVGDTAVPTPRPYQYTDNVFSIVEALLVSGDYGAISYYGSVDTGETRIHGVFDQHFFTAYAEGHQILGDMWKHAHEQFVSIEHLSTLAPDGSWLPPAAMHSISRFILFGDPSLRVGGIEHLSDFGSPVTSIASPSEWYSSLHLNAVDGGTNPSGVRHTFYKLHDATPYLEGNHITFDDEGTYTLHFYSEDMMGNVEDPKVETIKVDSTPPITSLKYNGEEPATLLCVCLGGTCDCPPRGCFDKTVEISLNASDAASGPDSTYYELDGGSAHLYSTPLDVGAGNYVTFYTIRYWSVDKAGNNEIARTNSFCVTNAQAGIIRDEMRILAGLEEIIMMQVRKDYETPVPAVIDHVLYQYRVTGTGDWITMGSDYDGSDGWQVMRDTTLMGGNGARDIRLSVYGFPITQPAILAPSVLLDSEILQVQVSNLDNAKYDFDLSVSSHTANPGDAMLYTFKFNNRTGGALDNLTLIAQLDPASFDTLNVLDGGSLNANGLPEWTYKHLENDQTWQVRFQGKFIDKLLPGTPVSAQGMLTMDGYPLVVSNDPSTLADEDYTLVSMAWKSSTVSGMVEVDGDLQPLAATLTLTGPVTRTASTTNGAYSFANVPRGSYTLSVSAPGYEYVSPDAAAAVVVRGFGSNVKQDFFMRRVDTLPPKSNLDDTVDELVQGGATSITGTAEDPLPGSGVSKVEVEIRNRLNQCWKLGGWAACPVWLPATGTTTWSLSVTIPWAADEYYNVASRATDSAGNVETPIVHSTSPTAPSLTDPLPGAIIRNGKPWLNWSEPKGAHHYILNVSTSPDFSDSVNVPVELYKSEYQLTQALPTGKYYWRVQALSAQMTPGAWSANGMFLSGNYIYLPVLVR